MTLGQRYANALEQLLPQGWAWSRRGCDDSLLGRLLRAWAEELARFHVWYEWEIRKAIERFVDMPQGWSAPDYERLLTDKFSITAAYVRDNDHWLYPKLAADHRQKYVFRIRSAAGSPVTPTAQVYLKDYAQSHTAPHITRDFTAAGRVASALLLQQRLKRNGHTNAVPIRPGRSSLHLTTGAYLRQTLTRRLTEQ